MTWTDERVAELKRLRDEGCSAELIADRLGTTRNAVLGKAWRLRTGLTTTRYRAPHLVAKGDLQGVMLRVSIGFSPDVHEQISAMAMQKGCSFGEQVRQLVAAGLLVEQMP